ncbi:hypothetical protein BAU01nite_23300 [Brevibacterium aurantiacum]|nr:hypothetical protein BAU01nite_23300 [Brevibacterium aurantiacum]
MKDLGLAFDRIVVMSNDIDRLGGIGRFMNQMAIEFHSLGIPVEMVGVGPAPVGHLQPMSRPHDIDTTILMSEHNPSDWTLRKFSHKLNPVRRGRYRVHKRLEEEAVSKLRHKFVTWGPRTLILCTQVYGMEYMLKAGYDANDMSMPRVIGQYHGSAAEASNIGDMNRVRKSYTDVDRFICLSSEDAELFQAAGLNNVGWIPNPVAIPEHEAVQRRNVFMSLGRYDSIKSLDYFLRAWDLVNSVLPDWSVELYGEGPERDYLAGIIDDYKIPRATLKGRTDSVGDVLASSRVHVLSSQNEGLPISIVEAGHMGCPSVAFDCAPGVSTLIDDGIDGLIVEQNNLPGLADGMRKIAESPELWSSMSESAVEHASHYLPEQVMRLWVNELLELSS